MNSKTDNQEIQILYSQEHCPHCGGKTMRDRDVIVPLYYKNVRIEFLNVPARECMRDHHRLYDFEVLQRLQDVAAKIVTNHLPYRRLNAADLFSKKKDED
jgi:YgiT-type zinc finger domain-containing protein